MKTRMAWSGICGRCGTEVVVAAHDDTTNEVRKQIKNGPGDWDGFTDCYVCDGSIDWNGSDLLPLTIR